MSNIKLCYPNRAAGAAYSGQGWVATLPVQHLTTQQVSQVARSHPMPLATVYASYGAATEAGVIALAGHNLSIAGQWRVRGYSSDPRPYVDRSAQVATLDLPFDRGTLPPGLACTRASPATYFDGAGLLQTAAADTARATHDLATLEPQGLLVEAAATNLVEWARDLTNAWWTKSGMTAALTATGLTGVANSATRLTATGANATVKRALALSGGRWSLYARRVSGSGTVEITSDDFVSTQTIALTTGWQRFDRFTSASGTIGIRIVTSGDVIEVDAVQAEAGVVPTSPILTAGSTGTRAAETVTYTVGAAAQPSLQAGTLALTWAIRRELTSGGMQDLATVRDTGGTSHVKVRMTNVSLGAEVTYTNGGTGQASLSLGGSIALGEEHTVAASWGANNYRATRQAATPATDASGTVASAAAAAVVFSTPADCGYTVRRITFLPATTVADADLQALSAPFAAPTAGYDSGWVDAWPAEWVSSTTAEQRAGARSVALHLPASPQSWQHWRLDLRDLTRSHVDLGRVFMGSVWTPTHGLVYGGHLGYQSRASTVETDSGAEYHVTRPNPRVLSGTLEAVTDPEALDQVLEMQRQLGTTGELLVMLRPSHRARQPVFTWLGRQHTLQPVVPSGYRRWSVPIDIRESL